ncbi:MAG: bifunctional (p)ppGpp synthetase/guanosine-3',5'-bis(diphosphate) 3'-pyrophosphohydrolase [Hydrococcus sp. C42_A2020_068]|uniref:RelA/SpoT family protein n=1 Tax=Pleurocapsa sp. PCC 7327 TaxID=118163 RepID=UPI00029F812E|nr:bifunctional (p)ppGpp synthetase/guanosine-3',5'-bis(diphosphate) 3'-pyrophosphohydrolase [Pleurocapsa sp. PCC 7327]AFY76575.1 (p)ppGpp synthetase, RelA/SpoT family [Pleurocapsa sp. PCC 7327]MBF2022562.1 bifunctional (p)ppGpp synthetase/guanosine-3',5'-bis(diphosphate) 3'-pyrophosphohydrolase [Hydrococcus sp. C42_A2020_068]
MNATTITLPNTVNASEASQSLELPDWLQECLIAYKSDPKGDRAEELSLICRAFNFAYELHEGQYRKSGEPYIAHPIAVASLLRDLGGDKAMIAAGFLHDVVEDTDVTLEEIEERFGAEVRQLVEGVTKLSKFNFSSKTERQAENFRRMFLAMAKDIRVIIVKLADRLHNMRTLEHLKPEKQRSIALETREIFAPLANRLGIGRLKWELEDLAFKYLEPEAYRAVQSLVAEKRTDREARLEKVSEMLRERLTSLGINVREIKGRPKHLYGIYQKMQRQQKEFHEIYDIAALRIIVDSKDECYRALAVVHDAFRPIPGRFKDYIGLPKPNRYQSLHTTVVGLNGRPMEVQIRTLEMHHIAEYGIAAHWKYKETGGSSTAQLSQEDEKFTWLRQLLEWQNDLKDAQEYVDNLKDNLFEDDVYVFTPKGDVVALAQGATPVDFAYHIHTEIGHHMKGARINGRWSVLDTPLQNGDIVEIITQKNAHPSLDWLNFVVTPSARNRIRQWYKRSRREENIARGRELLEKELGKSGLEALLKSEPMQVVAERCNYQTVEDLLAALGYGELTSNQVVNRLREITIKAQQAEMEMDEADVLTELTPPTPARHVTSTTSSKSPIAGVEGLLYHIAKCCHPIPGEAIVGVVGRGSRGIAIHRQGCVNAENAPVERLIPVKWNPIDSNGRPQTYPVDIQIEAIDRVGVLKDILSRLSDQNINVRNAGVKTSSGKPALISLSIDIQDRQQLDRTFDRIKNMSDVIDIRRVGQVAPDLVK